MLTRGASFCAQKRASSVDTHARGAERERRQSTLLGAFAHAFDPFGDERDPFRNPSDESDVPGEAPPGVQVGGEEADEARRAAAAAAALAATIPPPPPPPPPPPAPPTPPPAPPAREKTLAGTIDRILEKEFKEEAQACVALRRNQLRCFHLGSPLTRPASLAAAPAAAARGRNSTPRWPTRGKRCSKRWRA